MKLILFVAVLNALLAGMPQMSHAAGWAYIRADGGKGLLIGEWTHDFEFTSGDLKSSSTGERFGGRWTDCSSLEYQCIKLETDLLSIPFSTEFPDSWKIGTSTFYRVNDLSVGDEHIWFVQAVNSDGRRIAYTYSRERGIKTLSIRSGDGALDTYLSVGLTGLFAKK